MATVDDFLVLDIRAGTIVSASLLRGAREPAYCLDVDFGELGRRSAAVPIEDLYEREDLTGLQVTAVVNLPPKTISGYVSEVLVLTVADTKGGRVLLIPERPVPDGGRVS